MGIFAVKMRGELLELVGFYVRLFLLLLLFAVGLGRYYIKQLTIWVLNNSLDTIAFMKHESKEK